MKDGYSFAEEVERLAEAIFKSASIWNEILEVGSPKVVASCLLVRTLSNFRGGLILLQHNRLVEARILARCCFENLFATAALGQDGKAFIKLLEADHKASQKSRAEFLLQHVPADAEQGETDPLKVFLIALGKNQTKSKTLTPKEVAKKGPIFKAYAYYGELSADAAHPTMDSLLGRYLGSKQEGQEIITTIDIDPSVNSQEARMTLFYMCEALLGVCVWVSEIQGGAEMNGAIQKVMDHYKTLRVV